MKTTIKMSLRLIGKNPPTFMEGEKPGVFVTQEAIIDAGTDPHSMEFVRWLLERKKELVNETVKFEFEKLDE